MPTRISCLMSAWPKIRISRLYTLGTRCGISNFPLCVELIKRAARSAQEDLPGRNRLLRSLVNDAAANRQLRQPGAWHQSIRRIRWTEHLNVCRRDRNIFKFDILKVLIAHHDRGAQGFSRRIQRCNDVSTRGYLAEFKGSIGKHNARPAGHVDGMTVGPSCQVMRTPSRPSASGASASMVTASSSPIAVRDMKRSVEAAGVGFTITPPKPGALNWELGHLQALQRR